MPATFVLSKGSTGKFRFNLVASNGQVVATSEAYNTKAAAMAGIASVRKNASGAGMDDRTKAATPAKAAAAPAKKATARKPAAKRASAASSTTAAKKTTSAKRTTAKPAARKSTGKARKG